ncbi:MAG: hypothetical protein HY569_01195 [Candidatus Magasanikbacteria bacterium]|nr:hypothetical protein [Candidatus Magasanikbacteria bacterium]
MPIVYLENPDKWLVPKKKMLADFVSQAEGVFEGGWEKGSLWQLFSFFVEEMETVEIGDNYNEIEKIYLTYFAYLANDDFADISNLLKTAVQNRVGQSNVADTRKRVELQNILELKKSTAVDLINRLSWDELEKLMDLYARAKKKFILISTALLHYQPARSLDYEQLKMILLGEELSEEKIKDWLPVVRHLAQGFFGDDGQVRDLAVGVLVNLKAQENGDDSFTITVITALLLFVAFKDFYSLNKNNKIALLSKYGWCAMLMGVPWQKKIQEGLTDEPFLEYYVSSSEILAKSILDNQEPIVGGSALSLGGFISQYAAAVPVEKQNDSLRQDQFIAELNKVNDWPEEIMVALKGILDFYLHLRDCDLVDYKGMLSEAGVKSPPFDWRDLVFRDLSDVDLAEVREYMKILRRPFSVRSVIIVDFMDVDWRKEPYLSRLLTLSEVYEEIYGPIHEPLVYFDDKTGQWELNQTRPPII